MNETPTGGLTLLGIHLVDAMIDLFGSVDEAYAQSFNYTGRWRTDDTTSILLRMRNGPVGHLGVSLATAFIYRFQVFGSEGWATTTEPGMGRLEFVMDAPSPSTGIPAPPTPEVTTFDVFDMARAKLESFAGAAQGRAPYPISVDEAIHGVAVLEAISTSVSSGNPVAVSR